MVQENIYENILKEKIYEFISEFTTISSDKIKDFLNGKCNLSIGEFLTIMGNMGYDFKDFENIKI